MSSPARRELLRSTAPHHAAASKKEKQIILDEFTAETGYHRVYAITLLRRHRASKQEPTGGWPSSAS